MNDASITVLDDDDDENAKKAREYFEEYFQGVTITPPPATAGAGTVLPTVHTSAKQILASGTALAGYPSEDLDVSLEDSGVLIVPSGEFKPLTPTDASPSAFLPYERAYDRVVAGATVQFNQLEGIYTQVKEQSKEWNLWGIRFAISGLVILALAAILFLLNLTTYSGASFVFGAISEAIAVIFFSRIKDANKRVDNIQGQIEINNRFETAFQMVHTIDDPKDRNGMIKDLVRKYIELDQTDG